jgi:murein L,D-transpeptidase YcbB/YkuD
MNLKNQEKLNSGYHTKILNKKNIPIVLTVHEAYPQIVQEGDLQLFTDAYAYADHIVVLTEDA